MSSTLPTSPSALADRLHSAAIHLLRFARADDPRSGVTPSRLSALSVLVIVGPRTIGRLAGIEQVTAASMSVTINDLEDAGLVRRTRSPTDGRLTIVEATPRGRRTLQRARTRRVDRILEGMRHCSEGDLRALDRAARLIERIGRQDSSATTSG